MASKIVVYRGGPTSGVYSPSPFVTKLEIRLRFDGFTTYTTEAGSLFEAPRGKLPYVRLWMGEDATSPELLGDSTLIAQRLVDCGTLSALNAELTPELKAKDLCVRALLEDKVVHYMIYERFLEKYHLFRDVILGFLPWPVRVVAGIYVFRRTKAALHAQGTGRFTSDEVQAFLKEAWDGIEALLVASKSKSTTKDGIFWLLGEERPTEADATLYGFIAVVLAFPDVSPNYNQIIRNSPTVMEYAEKLRDKFFSDYPNWKDAK